MCPKEWVHPKYMSKKTIDIFYLLLKEGKNILKKQRWNKNTKIYDNGAPSNDDYSRFLSRSINLVEDSLGKNSGPLKILKNILNNKISCNNSYYFADCYGALEAAFQIYKEKNGINIDANKLRDIMEQLSDEVLEIINLNCKSTKFLIWKEKLGNIFNMYEFKNKTYEEDFKELNFGKSFKFYIGGNIGEKEVFEKNVWVVMKIIDNIIADINEYGEKAFKLKEKFDNKNIIMDSKLKTKKSRCFFSGRDNCNEDTSEECNWIFQAYDYNNKNTERVINNTINKVLSGKNLIPKPAKDSKKNKDYICKICQIIKKSKYFFADISTKNENVALEIGLAIGLGKKIIIISRRDPNKFSNLKRHDITLYKLNNLGDLKYEFQNALDDLIKE